MPIATLMMISFKWTLDMALAHQMEVVKQSIDNNTNTMVVILLTSFSSHFVLLVYHGCFHQLKGFLCTRLVESGIPKPSTWSAILPSPLNITPRLWNAPWNLLLLHDMILLHPIVWRISINRDSLFVIEFIFLNICYSYSALPVIQKCNSLGFLHPNQP